jgi:hypothetical protein
MGVDEIREPSGEFVFWDSRPSVGSPVSKQIELRDAECETWDGRHLTPIRKLCSGLSF